MKRVSHVAHVGVTEQILGPSSRLLRSEKPLCVLQDVAYSPESACSDGWLADCPDDAGFKKNRKCVISC